MQRTPGITGPVEVELNQQQAAKLRPSTLLQLLVGLNRTLCNQLGCTAGVDTLAAAAQQRGRQLEIGHVAALLLGHPLGIGQHRLAYCVDQFAGAQLAFFAQPGHDHCLWACHRQYVVRVRALVVKNMVHAGRVGVQAGRQRLAHGVAHQAVDHPLGAGQHHGPVMPEQQRLIDEFQVAVEHRHPQRSTFASRTLTLKATGCQAQHLGLAGRWH